MICSFFTLGKYDKPTLVILRILETVRLDSTHEVLQISKLLNLEHLLYVSLAHDHEFKWRVSVFRSSDRDLDDNLVLLGPDHLKGASTE